MRSRFFLLSVVTVVLIFSLATGASAGTRAYWRFEEGGGTEIGDISGDGNDGALLNGPVFSADVPLDLIPLTGMPNNFSLAFDGVNDIAVISDSPSLQPNGAITLEAWVYPLSGARVILGKQLFGGCCVNSYQLELNPFRFQLTDTSGNDHLIQGRLVPSPGAWHHIAGTWDGATMRLYLDGVEVATGPFFGPIGYDSNPVLIGGEDDGLGIPGCCLFSGNIDEVRISDVALDPSEFLSSDRCGERLAECQEDLNICEEGLDLCQEDLASCNAELATARTDLAACEDDLDEANMTISDLLIQIEQLQEENADLRSTIGGIEELLVDIEEDFRAEFNDPGFTIPGQTTLERARNLVTAILTLQTGPKRVIYMNLGGNARGGRP